jgi:hypothetical protein
VSYDSSNGPGYGFRNGPRSCTRYGMNYGPRSSPGYGYSYGASNGHGYDSGYGSSYGRSNSTGYGSSQGASPRTRHHSRPCPGCNSGHDIYHDAPVNTPGDPVWKRELTPRAAG